MIISITQDIMTGDGIRLDGTGYDPIKETYATPRVAFAARDLKVGEAVRVVPVKEWLQIFSMNGPFPPDATYAAMGVDIRQPLDEQA